MKSPFLYAGGKYYARKYIDKHLRSSEVYCEPYAGGGSIFFHKDKSNKTILNDLDDELINTYRIIRDYPAELIKQLDCFELPSKEFYDYLKYEYKPSNEIEEASRWYYLNRCTYGGITCKTNMSYSYKYGVDMDISKWGNIITKASEKLQGVELTCTDGIEVINSLPNDTFVFVDPPYILSSQNTLYKHSYELTNHYDLADCIRDNKNRLFILMTIDNNEISRDLYNFMYIEDINYSYGIDNKNKKTGSEIIIRNY